jgi:endonuclease/exonuclease/phosphatase family metal-dependent hydrolase
LKIKRNNLFLRKLFIILTFGLLAGPVRSQDLKFLTYNIRLDTPTDGPNAWPLRKAWLCEQVKQVDPDIFGIQEGLPQQVSYIDSSFSDYRHIGVGRDDGKTQGEFSAIWFNTKKFKLITQGSFWLSTTPEKPSMGWDAACKRVCTYGLFTDIKGGKQFWVFNTHFDHIGIQARKNSATLILQEIERLNTSRSPVILMGDFNSGPESEPIKIITGKFQDSKVADKSMSMVPDGTFNGFGAVKPATERIDFIFTGYGARAINYHVIRELKEGRYASDHFPVVAEVSLK